MYELFPARIRYTPHAVNRFWAVRYSFWRKTWNGAPRSFPVAAEYDRLSTNQIVRIVGCTHLNYYHMLSCRFCLNQLISLYIYSVIRIFQHRMILLFVIRDLKWILTDRRTCAATAPTRVPSIFVKILCCTYFITDCWVAHMYM